MKNNLHLRTHTQLSDLSFTSEERIVIDKITKARLQEGHSSPFKIQVCPFGSCQYNPIHQVYKLCLDLINALGMEKFEVLLGVKGKHNGPKKLEHIEYDLRVLMEEQIDRQRYALQNDKLLEEDTRKERLEMVEEEEQTLKNNLRDEDKLRLPIEGYFQTTRESSWDLWSAAIYLDFILKDLQPTPGQSRHEVEHTPLYQIISDFLQLEVYYLIEELETGIGCALLTHYYQISEETFAGFDT